MTRLAASLAAAVLFAALPGQAAEAADSYETTLSGESEAPASSVVFSEKGCEEECNAASLHCDGSRRISFDVADVPSKNAAAAITSDKQEIAVKAGGKTFGFPIEELRFVELTGSWDVSGHLFTDPAAFTAALAKAASFKATLGGQSLTLPVTADVKTWAAACVK
ncbi:hypothetical protein [Taklimakanibacter deserti]|uniref:hypothetical protein n=1 Tax=Taklimakanibacter deserti TaxID=2267839 RepID=UPI000E65A66E